MQYRNDKNGNKLSILGYGCMRFTKNGTKIDLDKAQRELLAAIDNGVNYLDTAYIYPGNEIAVGEILTRTGYRDKVYLATKLPHYMIKTMSGVEKTFTEELKRLQTDHVDYYLMHMLNDVTTWQELVKMGMVEWIADKKASGRNEYKQVTAMRKNPTSASQCIKCGKCEQHCPQGIPVREKLEEASRELETLPYKVIRFFGRLLKLYK